MQEFYIKSAIKEAEKAFSEDEVPVGAVIVDYKNNKIIASCHNINIKSNDPTAHAEIEAIRKACLLKNTTILDDCDIYVSLEPCPMCAQAISISRFRRLYFGAYDIKSGGVEHGAKIFSSTSCHHKPDVYGGIMEKECGDILKKFFKGKR